MESKREKMVSTRITDEQYQTLRTLAGSQEVSTFLFETLSDRLKVAAVAARLEQLQSPEPLAPPPPSPPPAPPPRVPPSAPWIPPVEPNEPDAYRTPEEPDKSGARWPSRQPLGATLAVLLALFTVWGTWRLQTDYRWTALQRERWPAYVQSLAFAQVGFPAARYAFLPPGRYQHATVYEYLRASVYGGESLFELWRWPLTAGLVVFIVGLVFGVRRDTAVRHLRRVGRIVKGPMLLEPASFARWVRGDGLTVEQRKGHGISIPKAAEPMHVSVSGGTGSGKSTLIRQWLGQIAERGETAVVYDPAREFVGQFYRPERGDVILNPFDDRFPGWAIGAEVEQDAEAMAVAAALFLSKRTGGDDFFRETPRRIFAHLLTRRPRPTAAQLMHWLANADLLDDVLNSTEDGKRYAAMIPKAAYHQHGGIMAELNLVGDALSTLPPETPQSWSAAAWAKNRKGWLFVTGGPSTRERQLPLMTLWLDLVLLRLMQGRGERRTWIVIDELASIGRLPQLPTALTEARKFNVAVVLGFQSTSQLEAIYGQVWRAMVAQPATHIVLRTTEPECAKWEASLLGDVKRERFKETRTKTGRKWSRSEALETLTEPLVMASQIGGLPPLEGFLKYENAVVKIRFAFGRRPSRAAPFLPREA